MAETSANTTKPTPERSLRIGFIGLGDIGGPMAENIARHRWPLTLYARRPVSLERFRQLPITIATTPRAVGAASDILCICVVDEAQVLDVLFGQAGAVEGLQTDSVVLLHSTLAPEACQRLAKRLSTFGLHLVDAPVSGAGDRALSGKLTILVGGETAIVKRCKPLLETEGSHIFYPGAVGSGQTLKLLNNSLFVIQLSLVDEIMKLSEKMNLDSLMVLKAIDSGTGSSFSSGFIARAIEQGKPIFREATTTYPGGAVEIIRKDVKLFLAHLQGAGLASARIAGIAEHAIDSIRAPLTTGASSNPSENTGVK